MVDDMRRCSRCKELKSVDEFGKDRSRKDGLTGRCKGCMKEYQQSDNGKAAQRKYRQSDSGKVAHKKYNQSVRGKAAQRGYDRKQSQTPERKAYVRNYHAKRNARKANLSHTLTAQDWSDKLDFFSNQCIYCWQEFPPEDLHQEHVVPVLKDGGYDKDNIVPSCQSCNSSKNATDLLDFLSRIDTRYDGTMAILRYALLIQELNPVVWR